MQSHPINPSVSVKKEPNIGISSSFSGFLDGKIQQPIEVSSSSEDESPETKDLDDQSAGDSSKQLVLYDPVANGASEIQPFVQPIRHEPQTVSRCPGFNMPPRVLPSVGAFSVQCAKCFKWRLIPTKEKYEAIREHILEQPFFCETASEWRPDISCDVPADIYQDDSRLWAIDKPNIAQPPRGWQRLLRIRGEGSTRFADVYYQAPSGKRLRSMVEVQKYLTDHPEYQEDGVTISRFSFQIPKPLQENYVRKRQANQTTLPLEGEAPSPLSWASPDECTTLQLGRSILPPPPSFHIPISPPFDQSAEKRARRSLS
ncbi:methyl-CpG-binding domain-containing protein 2 [Euphorbia lathyris]|uniref:methyl-CpG-binding domain-containing protein 2 n=1 Tax=Euphorbia lathyris TaxID=212925 RepID=UPI0033132A31